MRYKQLTYEQRCQIEVLKKRGLTQKEIASAVQTSQSTISRELNRNTGERGYRHKQANNRAIARRMSARKATKMTTEMCALIREKLCLKWSPEQISGWLLYYQQILLSHESIYRYIWIDKRAGGELFKHLRRFGKRYNKRSSGQNSRGHIPNRVGIEHRPVIVEQKGRVGDWEIDTVIGKGHSGALVTIVERKTLFTVCAQVAGKSASAVTDAVIRLLKPYAPLVNTITADNGKEFAYHEEIAKALDATVYFANPYSSWERGLNENTNGLLRQYWPKSTDFKKITQKAVERVIDQLNNRPRMTLDFQTPASLMEKYIQSLAA